MMDLMTIPNRLSSSPKSQASIRVVSRNTTEGRDSAVEFTGAKLLANVSRGRSEYSTLSKIQRDSR